VPVFGHLDTEAWVIKQFDGKSPEFIDVRNTYPRI
jgi:hypothetical protein